jgi:hypothetical protein
MKEIDGTGLRLQRFCWKQEVVDRSRFELETSSTLDAREVGRNCQE